MEARAGMVVTLQLSAPAGVGNLVAFQTLSRNSSKGHKYSESLSFPRANAQSCY